MKIQDALLNPLEGFYKSRFKFFNAIYFFGYALISSIYLGYDTYSSGKEDLLTLSLAPVGCFIHFLLGYLVWTYSGKNHKTGLLTFLAFMYGVSLFSNYLLLSLYFFGLSPVWTTSLLSLPKIHYLSWAILPFWVFYALKIRQINFQHQVRELIESSVEATNLLQKLENPENQQVIDDFFNYVLVRLPVSQHSCLNPLKEETKKRLASFKEHL